MGQDFVVLCEGFELVCEGLILLMKFFYVVKDLAGDATVEMGWIEHYDVVFTVIYAIFQLFHI